MKMKRFIAFTGIFILCALYIATFISALMTTPATPELFKACVFATIIVPVFFYVYLFTYKILKERAETAKKELEDSIPKTNDEDV